MTVNRTSKSLYTIMRITAIVLVMIFTVGNIPVRAASKSVSMKVSTGKELKEEIKKTEKGTIVIKTDKKVSISIPSTGTSVNKKLVIEAPNATISNSTLFTSVTINAVKAYTEKVSGNTLVVKATDAKVTIAKGKKAKVITLAAKKSEIILKAKSSVGSIETKKKSAKVLLSAGKKSRASVSLIKKTELSVSGENSSKISVISLAKGNAVTFSVPVSVKAEKNLTMTLLNGAEGSSVDLASKDVRVTIKGTVSPKMTVKGKPAEQGTIEDKNETSEIPAVTDKTVSDGKSETTGTNVIENGESVAIPSMSAGGNTSGNTGTPSGVSSGSVTSSTGGISVTTPVIPSGSSSGGSTVIPSNPVQEQSSGGAQSGSSETTPATTEPGVSEPEENGSEISGNLSEEPLQETEETQNATPTATENEIKDESKPEGVMTGGNMSLNNYISNWADPIRSYLYEEDGFFYRVEKQNFKNEFCVEKYDSNWKLADSSMISFEASFVWGGFYAGTKYNYVLIGQNNYEEDDEKVVFRIIQFDKDWNETGYADVRGGDTTVPFSGGTARMAERDGILYVMTCHNQYADSSDLRHQSSMLITVDEEKMTTAYTEIFDDDNIGLASHSFNQFIFVNSEGDLVMLNQGDAVPRAIMVSVSRFDDNNRILEGTHYIMQNFAASRDSGDMFWLNRTGAMVGGITETSKGYVVAYVYDGVGGQNDPETYVKKDVYVGFLSKKETYAPARTTGTVIRYDKDGEVAPGNPHIVAINEDEGYIFWEEYDDQKKNDREYTINYLKYYSDGSISEIRTFKGRLSDCVPIFVDGKIYWYVEYFTAPLIYSFDTVTEEISTRYVCGEQVNRYESTEVEKQAEKYYGPYDLIIRNMYDEQGKMTGTEYLDRTGMVCASLSYDIDEVGNVKGGIYTPYNEIYGVKSIFTSNEGISGRYVSKRREIFQDDDSYQNRYMEYEYDENGNILLLVEQYHEIGPERDICVSTTYTRFGLTTERVFLREDNDESYTVKDTYKYNEKWNKETHTKLSVEKNAATGTTITQWYEYNGAGILTDRWAKKTVEGKSDYKYEYEFDSNGNVTELKYSDLIDQSIYMLEYEPGTFDEQNMFNCRKETFIDLADENNNYELIFENTESGTKVTSYKGGVVIQESIDYPDGSSETIFYKNGTPEYKQYSGIYEEDPDYCIIYTYDYVDGNWIQRGEPVLSL